MQTFGGTKNFLPHALATWEGRAEAEEARHEADARTDEQRRRERDEEERRRRLADRRAALSDEALATLRHRAEEVLAADGVERTHLGYDVLVKLTLDELLLEARHEGDHPTLEAATPEATPTSRASNGREAGTWRAGEIWHVGREASRHGCAR
jgi:Asp-tRNA(Asn)/Glu-tRNA(Gln) amidotransferase A subunit family amidase